MSLTISLALVWLPLNSAYESSEHCVFEPCHYAFDRSQGRLSLVVSFEKKPLMKKKLNAHSNGDSAPSDYAAYVGIDWADRKHDICHCDAQTQKVEHTIIDSRPEAIDAWAEGLRAYC